MSETSSGHEVLSCVCVVLCLSCLSSWGFSFVYSLRQGPSSVLLGMTRRVSKQGWADWIHTPPPSVCVYNFLMRLMLFEPVCVYTSVQLWEKMAFKFPKQNESQQHFKRGCEDLSTIDKLPGNYSCVDCHWCWASSTFVLCVMLGALYYILCLTAPLMGL